VAEDDPGVRQAVVIALRRLTYDIVETCDGRELTHQLADALLTANPVLRPDLIISANRMPGMTGLVILEGLRFVDWSTPFILMTRHPDLETREEADRLGVDGFFAKPFEIEQLVALVLQTVPVPPAPAPGDNPVPSARTTARAPRSAPLGPVVTRRPPPSRTRPTGPRAQ
jgi:CheY-like chemotaxis protein